MVIFKKKKTYPDISKKKTNLPEYQYKKKFTQVCQKNVTQILKHRNFFFFTWI